MSTFALNLSILPAYKLSDVVTVSVCASLVFALVRSVFFHRGKETKLVSPENPSWLWGFTRDLLAGVSGDYFEGWQEKFGDIYRIPYPCGTWRTVVMDPRAIAYILNSNSYNFVRHKGNIAVFKRLIGGGILTYEGEAHRRHRKSMSPGFSVGAIRYFTTIFLDAATKVMEQWISQLEAETERKDVIVNIEQWMNAISFESIGQAGFNHDFECTTGIIHPVGQLFTALGKSSATIGSMMVLGLVQAFPFVLRLPLQRNRGMKKIRTAMTDVARSFKSNLQSSKGDLLDDRRSLVASIMKAENRALTESEVIGEMNTLLLAGFETTATTMTWCLHELSVNTPVQDMLRQELKSYPEPSYDQMATEMPYLTAVVQETLRIHPAAQENHRIVVNDDSIPIQNLATTAAGNVVDHLDVRAGTGIIIPIEAINRSTVIWGPDSHEFKPERWLTDLPEKAKNIQGYHHLMTFIDGPRNCIGKNFAVAEFKAVLAVLVRHFSFAPLKDGSDVGRVRTVTPRARNKGYEGLMLRVSKVESE
ncbi:cytochrome P450 [Calocera cornea HHB12733]|uniref:Cytochrome P450 n=1 Tax=Calocera cornea HHB12733 TaxID=1353952 RepID=A0A165D0V8_9BASI|nr:cytochrome P450 [Calocera cornea HHB12733]